MIKATFLSLIKISNIFICKNLFIHYKNLHKMKKIKFKNILKQINKPLVYKFLNKQVLDKLRIKTKEVNKN